MISLSDRKWQSFEIGDLFNVSGTTTTHPSVLKEKGNIPRITCQAVNNGLEGFYSNTPTEIGFPAFFQFGRSSRLLGISITMVISFPKIGFVNKLFYCQLPRQANQIMIL